MTYARFSWVEAGSAEAFLGVPLFPGVPTPKEIDANEGDTEPLPAWG